MFKKKKSNVKLLTSTLINELTFRECNELPMEKILPAIYTPIARSNIVKIIAYEGVHRRRVPVILQKGSLAYTNTVLVPQLAFS